MLKAGEYLANRDDKYDPSEYPTEKEWDENEREASRKSDLAEKKYLLSHKEWIGLIQLGQFEQVFEKQTKRKKTK